MSMDPAASQFTISAAATGHAADAVSAGAAAFGAGGAGLLGRRRTQRTAVRRRRAAFIVRAGK